MTYHIRSARLDSVTAVRDLVVEALLSHGPLWEVLDWDLPCPGRPLLALDRDRRPTILSLDTENATAALLDGLAAWDELRAHRAWVTRLHSTLSERVIMEGSRLLVGAPALPHGVQSLVEGNPRIGFFSFRVVRVNADPGVIVDLYPAPDAAPEHEGSPPGREAIRPDGLEELTLSVEEEAYFAENEGT